jgi:hypothetical protein
VPPNYAQAPGFAQLVAPPTAYSQPTYGPPVAGRPGYPPAPYGQPAYGPPGYPPAPYGQSAYPGGVPPRPPLDRLAVWSFITGLLSVLIVSIPLSIVGLIRTSRRERRGRGFAIAGLAFSLVWIMVIIGVIAFRDGRKPTRAADGTVTHQGSISPAALRNGDCVKTPSMTVGQTQTVTQLTVVPCSTPHNAQVFSTVQSSDASYPGLDQLAAEGLRDCRQPAQDYLGHPSATLLLLAFVPTQILWDNGNHAERCLLVDPVQEITGDIRQYG